MIQQRHGKEIGDGGGGRRGGGDCGFSFSYGLGESSSYQRENEIATRGLLSPFLIYDILYIISTEQHQ
jgi:hypothetical protein